MHPVWMQLAETITFLCITIFKLTKLKQMSVTEV